MRSWTGSHVIGDPATVRAQLEDLVARTGADELMLTTMLYATDDRIRSYRLVADEVALDPHRRLIEAPSAGLDQRVVGVGAAGGEEREEGQPVPALVQVEVGDEHGRAGPGAP